jgi:hypothetical protein
MQGLYWTEPVPAVLCRFGDAMTAETIGDFALATESAAMIDGLRQVEASAPPSTSAPGQVGPSAPRPPRWLARTQARPPWSRRRGEDSSRVLAGWSISEMATRSLNRLER